MTSSQPSGGGPPQQQPLSRFFVSSEPPSRRWLLQLKTMFRHELRDLTNAQWEELAKIPTLQEFLAHIRKEALVKPPKKSLGRTDARATLFDRRAEIFAVPHINAGQGQVSTSSNPAIPPSTVSKLSPTRGAQPKHSGSVDIDLSQTSDDESPQKKTSRPAPSVQRAPPPAPRTVFPRKSFSIAYRAVKDTKENEQPPSPKTNKRKGDEESQREPIKKAKVSSNRVWEGEDGEKFVLPSRVRRRPLTLMSDDEDEDDDAVQPQDPSYLVDEPLITKPLTPSNPVIKSPGSLVQRQIVQRCEIAALDSARTMTKEHHPQQWDEELTKTMGGAEAWNALTEKERQAYRRERWIQELTA